MRITCLPLLLALVGCHIENKLSNIGDLSDADCETACTNYWDGLDLPDSCNLDCGANVGANYTADTNTAIVSLGTLPGTEGTCDAVIDCTGNGQCIQDLVSTFAESGDLSSAEDGYSDCVRSNHCEAVRSGPNGCYDQQYDKYMTCIGNCSSTGTACQDSCSGTWQNDDAWCDCRYDVCVNQTGNCDKSELVLPPAPPAQTDTNKWTVTRRYISFQMNRLAALQLESMAWPVASRDHKQFVALAVDSIDPPDTGYKIGLRNGDQLVSINGRPVMDALADTAWLFGLKNTSLVTLVIHRGGTSRSLQYQIVP